MPANSPCISAALLFAFLLHDAVVFGSRPPKEVSAIAIKQSIQTWASGFNLTESSEKEVAASSEFIYDVLSAEAASLKELDMTKHIADLIMKSPDLPRVLAKFLSEKLFRDQQVQREALAKEIVAVLSVTDVLRAVCADVAKAVRVDPAIEGLLQPILFFKGFQALTLHRVANTIWKRPGPEKNAALLLQSLNSERFAVDIHPGATIGNGVMIDHATGVVIGGTAIVGNDVYILHKVTLGATGKPTEGQRHPTIGNGVLLGAGSSIIGNIKVGNNAKIGASAMVTKDVEDGMTVVGLNKVVCKLEEEHDHHDQKPAPSSAWSTSKYSVMLAWSLLLGSFCGNGF